VSPTGPRWVARSPRQCRGADGESRACRFLERQGLRIVARNVRYRLGELDIVAFDRELLVFVEVRVRGSLAEAASSLGPAKQGKMRRAAQIYLLRHHGQRWPACRFDAIFVVGGEVHWLRDAFH